MEGRALWGNYSCPASALCALSAPVAVVSSAICIPLSSLRVMNCCAIIVRAVVRVKGRCAYEAVLFCFAQTARTYQNSVMYPVYLLSGMLVPVTVFPDWLEPVSRLVFLYWSANLLRDSMQMAAPEGVLAGLGAIAALGACAAFAGGVLIVRMLSYLRREGRLGIL